MSKSPAELAAEEWAEYAATRGESYNFFGQVAYLAGVLWLVAELEKKAVEINKIGDDGYPKEEKFVPLSAIKELLNKE